MRQIVFVVIAVLCARILKYGPPTASAENVISASLSTFCVRLVMLTIRPEPTIEDSEAAFTALMRVGSLNSSAVAAAHSSAV